MRKANRSWYPLCIVLLCVRLVVIGASPLRTAANSLKILLETLLEFKIYKAPSFTTIKRWVQQVGYYKLKRPKTIANDWMLLIDASIQMGEKKCVLVLGCRERDFPKKRAMTLKDLEVLAVRIEPSLNSSVITQVLHEAASLVGKVSVICSDRGSEIIRGIKDFQISNPDARHVADTAHKVSNLLEATLEKSTKWKEFREQVTQARRRMQNSLIPGALPPSPRIKARYMNVDSLINWASDMLNLLDHGALTPELDMNEFKKYLGWLLAYREEVAHWSCLVSIGKTARYCVRIEGIHTNIVASFKQAISTIGMGFREEQFADQITLFLSEQSKGTKIGERFIGSTEVLESLFGKMKYMEQEQTAFGFTSLVLAAMACVGSTDEKTIDQALTAIKLSDIDEWSAKEIGQSVQCQRKRVKKIVANLRLQVEQEISGAAEGVAVGF